MNIQKHYSLIGLKNSFRFTILRCYFFFKFLTLNNAFNDGPVCYFILLYYINDIIVIKLILLILFKNLQCSDFTSLVKYKAKYQLRVNGLAFWSTVTFSPTDDQIHGSISSAPYHVHHVPHFIGDPDKHGTSASINSNHLISNQQMAELKKSFLEPKACPHHACVRRHHS